MSQSEIRTKSWFVRQHVLDFLDYDLILKYMGALLTKSHGKSIYEYKYKSILSDASLTIFVCLIVILIVLLLISYMLLSGDFG